MSLDPLKPIRLPLVGQPTFRDATWTKDARIVNGYIEKLADGGIRIIKRPGFTNVLPHGGSTAQGAFHSASQPVLFWIINSVLYVNNVPQSAVAVPGAQYRVATFGDYRLGTFINTASGFQTCYYWDSGGFHSVTAGGDGAGYVPGVAYLDGTIYILGNQGGIWGSDINNPAVWNGLNVIQASDIGSYPIRLARQKAYVVAFLNRGINVFYNAANASGSPLARLPGGQSAIGCVDANSVQEIADDLMWVGNEQGSGLGVYHMRDLKITKVSTPAVDRALNIGYTAGGGGFTPWFTSFYVSQPGHKFYIVNSPSMPASLVYDIETSMWTVWSKFGDAVMPFASSFTAGSGNNIVIPGNTYAQHQPSGSIMLIRPEYYQDWEGIFPVKIFTDPWDGGLRYKKHLKKMVFTADQVPGAAMNVQYTEDDYQTFSTIRGVDLGSKNPRLDNCGSFYKRAYLLTHQANTPFRIEAADLSIDVGTA